MKLCYIMEISNYTLDYDINEKEKSKAKPSLEKQLKR